MSVLTLRTSDGYLHFDAAECRREGARRASDYRNARPFPHIVIDDFLDSGLLRSAASDYPPLEGRTFFDRDQERLKFQFGPDDIPGGLTRNLLSELNSGAFLGFLEEMTGIEGLVSDPYFAGGGLHLTRPGGHLGIHADFNIHERMQVERRLNLLIYLNDEWDESYGGYLELWDQAMTRREVAVAPILGRAVIFNTTLDSYHGHPDPLTCPPDRDRRSIATYYYTALAGPSSALPVRDTNFKQRPKSADKRDWRVHIEHLILDWVPPRLQRYARRLNPFK